MFFHVESCAGKGLVNIFSVALGFIIFACQLCSCNPAIALQKKWINTEKDIFIHDNGRVETRYQYRAGVVSQNNWQMKLPILVPVNGSQLSKVGAYIECAGERKKVHFSNNTLFFKHDCPAAEISYHYTIISDLEGFQELFADVYSLPSFGVTRKAHYSLHFPRPISVSYKIIGDMEILFAPQKGKIKKDYEWSFVVKPEKDRSSGKLQVSAAGSWQRVAEKYEDSWGKQCKLNPDDFLLLFKKLPVRGAAANTLLATFKDSFKYQVNMNQGHMLVPQKCSVTLMEKQGDCKDLSLLFSTVLRNNGIAASPVLRIKKDTDHNFPDPFVFDHAMVIFKDNESLFLAEMATGKIMSIGRQSASKLLVLQKDFLIPEKWEKFIF